MDKRAGGMFMKRGKHQRSKQRCHMLEHRIWLEGPRPRTIVGCLLSRGLLRNQNVAIG